MAGALVAYSSSLSAPVALFISTSALSKSKPSTLSFTLQHARRRSLHCGFFGFRFLQQQVAPELSQRFLDHLLTSHAPNSFPSPAPVPGISTRQRFVVFSTQSRTRPNWRLRKVRRRFVYDDESSDDYDDDDDDEDYDDDDEEESDDEFSDFEEFDDDVSDSRESSKKSSLGKLNMVHDANGRGKSLNGKFPESIFDKLSEEFDLQESKRPFVEYLSSIGLKESDIVYMYERHLQCVNVSVSSARNRIEYLFSIGVTEKDLRKMLRKQPQILGYSVENNLKLHIAFLRDIGVADSRIRQIIHSHPSIFNYSIEHSLKPRVEYLVKEVGIKEADISKVIQLSPSVLISRIDKSWTSYLHFLNKELGASRESMVKMVTKHPQLLHYSIKDGIQPKINFLRSIGMQNQDILKLLTGLTQVLSLSLEGNLKPKYLYLVHELKNDVHSLMKYPTYLSLSLELRIRPRHKFLVSLERAPKGRFPLNSLVVTDKVFCQRTGTSIERYLAFKQNLLLSDFSKKYGRR